MQTSYLDTQIPKQTHRNSVDSDTSETYEIRATYGNPLVWNSVRPRKQRIYEKRIRKGLTINNLGRSEFSCYLADKIKLCRIKLIQVLFNLFSFYLPNLIVLAYSFFCHFLYSISFCLSSCICFTLESSPHLLLSNVKD